MHWNDKLIQLADTQEPIQIRFAYTGKVKRQHNRPAETMKKLARARRSALATKSYPTHFLW